MTKQAPPPEQVTLEIDGKRVSVEKGTLLVEAAKQVSVDVPIFCYHSRLKPVGACRMCLVEVEKMPRLQTACTTPVSEGMVVRTDSPKARAGREGVLSLLLSDHPLDCPICDKGGECPLQDNTFRYGPGIAVHHEQRNRKEKAFELSEEIILDRERCILCYRCVRFHEEIPGDRALAVIDRGSYGEIGVPEGQVYDSPFSGNTVDICPVGALTSRSYRFRARPWDLRHSDGVCVGCSVGCNVVGHRRDGRLLRLVPRENPAINDVWLCDRGRFDTLPAERQDRSFEPQVREGGKLRPATWDEALSVAGQLLGGGKAGALVGGALSNEAYSVLSRALTPRLPGGVALTSAAGTSWPVRGTLSGLAASRAILVVGLDIWREMPILALWIRAAMKTGAELVLVGADSDLARQATHFLPASPGEEGALLRALLDGREGKGELVEVAKRLAEGPVSVLASPRVAADPEARALLERLAGDASDGESSLVGAPGMGANARGAQELLGAEACAVDAEEALLEAIRAGSVDTLLSVEATLPEGVRPKALIELTWRPPGEDSTADVVLPLAHPYDQAGSFTSLDGTLQGFDPLGLAPPSSRADYAALSALAKALGAELPDELRALRKELAEDSPLYRSLPRARTELRLV